MAKLTVLLIDDDSDDREFFKIALEESDPLIGLKVASSGRQAFQVLSSDNFKPDFIFLDLNMPHMDGREFLTLVKKNPAIAEIPVVIFTTSSHPRDRTDTQSLGASDFITKPSTITELSEILTTFFKTCINQTK